MANNLAGGLVSKNNYEALKAERDRLVRRVLDLETEVASLRLGVQHIVQPGWYVHLSGLRADHIAPDKIVGPFQTDESAAEYLVSSERLNEYRVVRIEYQR